MGAFITMNEQSSSPNALLRIALIVAVTLLMASKDEAQAEQLLPGRSIRYTSGSATSSGWEQGLVEGTPNLGHFYWSPITSYSQNYVKVPLPANKNLEKAGNQPVQLRPSGSIYAKPIHVPLPANQNHVNASIQTANRVVGSVYAKPIHVPLPVARHAPLQTASSLSGKLRVPSGAHTSADVFLRLASEHVSGQIVHRRAAAPTIATYATLYASRAGTSTQASLASKDVHGKLLDH